LPEQPPRLTRPASPKTRIKDDGIKAQNFDIIYDMI
jgi:hypothetical protein